MNLLTKYQVAEKLNISVRTVEDMVLTRRIPYTKLGRLVRFSESELQKHISKKTIKTAQS